MKILDIIRYDDIRRRRHTMKQRVAEALHRAEYPDCRADDFLEALSQKVRAVIAEVDAGGSPVTIELLPLHGSRGGPPEWSASTTAPATEPRRIQPAPDAVAPTRETVFPVWPVLPAHAL